MTAVATTASEDFLEFWHEHGADHFRVEEEVLLPRGAGWIDPEVRLVADVVLTRG